MGLVADDDREVLGAGEGSLSQVLLADRKVRHGHWTLNIYSSLWILIIFTAEIHLHMKVK